MTRNEVLKRNRQQYHANRLEILERKRQDRLANPRKYRARDRRYREANRNRRNAYMIQYRLAKKRNRHEFRRIRATRPQKLSAPRNQGGRICARFARPSSRRTSQKFDELAPPHSITSSARISIDCGNGEAHHATAALPINANAMNSRRLMASPAPKTTSGIKRISHFWIENCRSLIPKRGRPCPLWVKSRHSVRSHECPLYPQKRTLHCTAANVRFVPKADILRCGRDGRYSIILSARGCKFGFVTPRFFPQSRPGTAAE